MSDRTLAVHVPLAPAQHHHVAPHTKHLLTSLVAIVALAVSVSAASAQCAFGHPKKARKIQLSLTQAFFDCAGSGSGYTPANTATEGGIPACKPPGTLNDSLSNSSAWRWDDLKGSGQVQFKASSTFPPNPLDPPSNTADVVVQLKLLGVRDASGPASGNGKLATLLRMTLNDRVNGDLTAVDYPVTFAFIMTGGKATLKSSIDTALNAAPTPHPGLPKCSSVELLATQVLDVNLNTFATTGLFLP